jgi:hypothetical protein
MGRTMGDEVIQPFFLVDKDTEMNSEAGEVNRNEKRISNSVNLPGNDSLNYSEQWL